MTDKIQLTYDPAFLEMAEEEDRQFLLQRRMMEAVLGRKLDVYEQLRERIFAIPGLTNEQKELLYQHEKEHLRYSRSKGWNPERKFAWNVAQDVAINDIILNPPKGNRHERRKQKAQARRAK